MVAREENDTARNQKLAIVGIGASAGGISALQHLFGLLPPDTGAAFVVIVHLDPQSRSELSSILAARSQMPVIRVADTEKLEPNRIYVISPDRRLQITDDEISAAEFDEPRGQRAPIDLFFRSLAEQHGDGFAVILTGAGSDGALGVKAVKEHGGIILVQDPAEAEYSSMPRSAIATGSADFVLQLKDLASALVDLIRNRESVSAAQRVDEDVLLRILAHVKVRTGHEFSKYKRSTVTRRIARRMQVTRTEDLQGYYNFLSKNADEAQALLSDLLISVTTFFRDHSAFEALKAQALPRLFEGKGLSDNIRVWVPGCATGEEAYSIAMLLVEEAGRRDIRPRLQIFASDLDPIALSIAREGRFPATIEADVSEERLRRFFSPEGDHYRVAPQIRDIVLFAAHDLIKDPPFSKIDLISCRNLLIYLDRDLQQNVCSTFHYALKPGGFLFLGQSETADNPPGLFRSIDRKARIYESTAHADDKPRVLPQLLGVVGERHGAEHGRAVGPVAALNEALSHRRALEEMAPPSILIDAMHRAVHLSENAGRYLQPAGGPLTGDVVDLVRPELRFELRAALHRAFERRKATVSMPILVRFNGKARRVHIQVRPTGEDGAEPRNAIVLFLEGEPVEESVAAHAQQQADDETVRRLAEELELTQGRLRTTREESEAGHEELRAANEELQSINEEYRSTAEELETSKEELQSVNEELQTLNQELKLKLEAVSRANTDLQNLMSAADFGTLFLDSSLHIKRFTDRVTELFNIRSADEGRPIADFAHQLEYQDLIEDARAVLLQLAPIRREIRSRKNRWYDVCVRPYRTADGKIDGVVVTFIDITERRRTENSLRQQKQLVELSSAPIFVWDFDGGILEWNRGSEALYGYSREEALGKNKPELLATVVPGSSFAELKATLLRHGSWSGELKHRTKDGRQLTVESRLELASFDDRRLVLESTNDITERKLGEERQQLMIKELNHRVRNSLAVVQAIARYTLRSGQSKEEFAESFGARLSALATCHTLLAESDWKGTDLEALVRAQLSPLHLRTAE